jgi:hypothetical protein
VKSALSRHKLSTGELVQVGQRKVPSLGASDQVVIKSCSSDHRGELWVCYTPYQGQMLQLLYAC